MARKRIGNFFICPKCGKKSISVNINKNKKQAIVICGFCQLTKECEMISVYEKEDYFGEFIDWFHGKDNVNVNLKEIMKEKGTQNSVKKEKSMEEIFNDSGYLEF